VPLAPPAPKIREETRDGEEMVECMLRVTRDENEATKGWRPTRG
jgi:hypothetical protein